MSEEGLAQESTQSALTWCPLSPHRGRACLAASCKVGLLVQSTMAPSPRHPTAQGFPGRRENRQAADGDLRVMLADPRAPGKSCRAQGLVSESGRLRRACCRSPDSMDGRADHGGLECHIQDVRLERGDKKGAQQWLSARCRGHMGVVDACRGGPWL